MSTKEKILDIALNLFNQNGATDVTTNHIASALEISPGNLYYHYKNKEEIIRALFDRINLAWDQAFAMPTDRPPTLHDLEMVMAKNFTLLWEYRFFYRDLMGLLRHDPELRESYQLQRQRGLHDTRELIVFFVQSGVLNKLEEHEIDALTRVAYLISDFWLPSIELDGQPITSEHLEQGVALMRAMVKPHLATN